MSENEHTINALIRKRAEIAGIIENLQGQLRRATLDLDNVEATLRIFAPEIDIAVLGPRRVPKAHHAFRGEVIPDRSRGAAHRRRTSLDDGDNPPRDGRARA